MHDELIININITHLSFVIPICCLHISNYLGTYIYIVSNGNMHKFRIFAFEDNIEMKHTIYWRYNRIQWTYGHVKLVLI